jgi:hypothetical protein
MTELIGRFYAKENKDTNHILIGASVSDLIKPGHVYEIVALPLGGGFQVNDLGKSVITDDISKMSMDRMLALSHGKHCMVASDHIKKTDVLK